MNFGPKNKIKVGGGLASISAVVLVMLIFFLVMTVVSKKEVKASAPETETAFAPATTVIITKDNQYYLSPEETDKDKRSFDQIKDAIIDKVVTSPTKQLMIEGHQLAKYETVYNVVGLAQKNNWQFRMTFTKEPAAE